MKRLRPGGYSVTACVVYASDQLYLHSAHDKIGECEPPRPLHSFKDNPALLDWLLIFQNVKAVEFR